MSVSDSIRNKNNTFKECYVHTLDTVSHNDNTDGHYDIYYVWLLYNRNKDYQ